MERKVYEILGCSPNRVAATLAKLNKNIETEKAKYFSLYHQWINEPGYIVQDFMP